MSVFRGDGEIKLHPHNCEVLEFTDDNLDPAEAVIHRIYWELLRPNSLRSKALKKICEKLNSPVGDKVNAYYIDRDSTLKRLSQCRYEYNDEIRTVDRNTDSAAVLSKNHQGTQPNTASVKTEASVAQDFVDKALMILENNPALMTIQTLADGDQNILAAFLLFCDYQRGFYHRMPHMNRKDIDIVLKELNKNGLDIIAKFRQKRSLNRKRESDFKALCPRKHGPWSYSTPAGIPEMLRRVQSCYQSFCKLSSTSAMSEFPEWGNAALEVMQMTSSVELERKFDSAIKMYQKRIKP